MFRRSFTAAFMSETGGATASTTSTLVLLAAAAVACVITSAAATPFEVLRVRSMGLVEAKPWKDVFVDYVVSARSRLIVSCRRISHRYIILQFNLCLCIE